MASHGEEKKGNGEEPKKGNGEEQKNTQSDGSTTVKTEVITIGDDEEEVCHQAVKENIRSQLENFFQPGNFGSMANLPTPSNSTHRIQRMTSGPEFRFPFPNGIMVPQENRMKSGLSQGNGIQLSLLAQLEKAELEKNIMRREKETLFQEKEELFTEKAALLQEKVALHEEKMRAEEECRRLRRELQDTRQIVLDAHQAHMQALLDRWQGEFAAVMMSMIELSTSTQQTLNQMRDNYVALNDCIAAVSQGLAGVKGALLQAMADANGAFSQQASNILNATFVTNDGLTKKLEELKKEMGARLDRFEAAIEARGNAEATGGEELSQESSANGEATPRGTKRAFEVEESAGAGEEQTDENSGSSGASRQTGGSNAELRPKKTDVQKKGNQN